MTIGLDRKLLAAVERLGRAWRAARQRQASLHNLSLLAVDILETLSDGRPRRVGAIAAELDIAQPTVSDALTPLDTRGLIRRERDVADRRSTVVTLSKTGRALAQRIEAELAPLAADGDPATTVARGTALRVLLEEIARLRAAGMITISRNCLTCDHYQPKEPPAGPRCLLLDISLADADLRVNCGDHLEAAPA